VETKEQYSSPAAGKLPSPGPVRSPKTLKVFERDLDKRTYDSLIRKPYLEIDTETDGLIWYRDKLRLIQVCTPERRVYMVRNPDVSSHRLRQALTCRRQTKYFHHVLFDLQFIKAWIGIDVDGSIECTKTLMKIVLPEYGSGLINSIKQVLGIQVKQPRVDHSKWKDTLLTDKQTEYAAIDVLYLHSLAQGIKKKATRYQLSKYQDAILAIKIKTQLEVEGFPDLLNYEQDNEAFKMQIRKRWAGILERGGTQ
jgi:ribonuclease D